MAIWQCWHFPGEHSLLFTTKDNIEENPYMISEYAELEYEFVVEGYLAEDESSFEEYNLAMAEHHKRQGWEPYKSMIDKEY